MKNKFIFFLLTCILLIFALNMYKNLTELKIEVIFNNYIGEDTGEFFLMFDDTTTPKSVNRVQANKTFSQKMVHNGKLELNNLKLYYFNYKKERIDVSVLDFIEPKYRGKVYIDIVDINNDGVYEFEIMEE